MFFLKKVFLCGLFAALMYFGGAGTQSDSTSLQGMGFMGVIIAFVILYILFKVMWSTVSFFFTFAVIGAVVAFILYCLGIIGGGGSAQNAASQLFSENGANAEYTQADGSMDGLAPVAADSGPSAEEDGGFLTKLSSMFGKEKEPAQISSFNPLDYPEIHGVPRVITGSVLRVRGIDVKLLGVDAPNPEQNCSNSRGQAYACGHKAVSWMQNWINGQEVKCHILGNVIKHRATGVCFLGEYDVAAAIVEAGWAVAYAKNTDVYVPYEKHARKELKGLWNGRFYRPSDWRKMQVQRAKISNEQKSDWFNFDGWF